MLIENKQDIGISKRYKIIIGLSLFILLMVLAGKITGQIVSGSGICGNLVCEIGETQLRCPNDCGGTCYNSICETGEVYTCPMDCSGNEEKEVTLLDGILDSFKK